MRRIVVTRRYDRARLDRFVRDTFGGMPPGAFYKALRNRDVKIDGKRVSQNCELTEGQCVELYIKDEVLLGNRLYERVFEDDNILVVNKFAGICVCDAPENETSLAQILSERYGCEIYPCHRLDRNTAGLVIFAKTKQAETMITGLIREHLLEKIYRCIVSGAPPRKADTVHAWLRKSSRDSSVEIFCERVPNSAEIITEYSVISRNDDTAMLEIRLITGRTHQIRAQMAQLGCPVLGDGKYGRNCVNKTAGYRWQALVAMKISFSKDGGTEYDGRSFSLTEEQAAEHFAAARTRNSQNRYTD